jgi:hypothetical protein
MHPWTAGALAIASVIATGGCLRTSPAPATPSGGDPSSWRYEVVVDHGSSELRVDAWLPEGSLADLIVRPRAERFVRDVEVEEENGWSPVPLRGAGFHVPRCGRGCHVRYAFALCEAADALHDVDLAMAWSDVIEASPSVWLLHPALAPRGRRYRFRVRTPADSAFVTGVFATDEGRPGTYEAEASTIGVAPYAAFGPLRIRHIEAAAGTTVDVAIAPGEFAASDDAIVRWVARSARTMARYFGCFPVENAMLLVTPVRGADVRRGETMGDGGASIVVELGDRADEAVLRDDWVLPHEMAHLAVPSVARPYHWIEEGIAVYVEPIARARAGELAPDVVWRQFAVGMPKGTPSQTGGGLDGTSSWARTYWGGAAFCLLADVEIRRRSGNRLGFDDALRGILAAGGSVARVWDFERLLDTGDSSVGERVLRPMHDQAGRYAWVIDLPRLFSDLGVVVEGDRVRLADDAPLADIRRAITEPLPQGAPEPRACGDRNFGPRRVAQR